MTHRSRASRYSACRLAAHQFECALIYLSIGYMLDKSPTSPSHYFTIADGRPPLKVRISDHAGRHRGMRIDVPHFNAWCDEEASRFTGEGDWIAALRFVCQQLGIATSKIEDAAILGSRERTIDETLR